MYLPQKIVTNDELAEHLKDTSDEWIRSRTGITKRHIASDTEYTSTMAYAASVAAIADAGIENDEIDLIIVATTTPDNSFPSVATKLHKALHLKDIPSFDIQAVCAGFIYAINIADSLMKSSGYKTALVVGSDKMSSLLDWDDRSTSILFGDGAGAIILKRSEDKSGIIASEIYSDGQYTEILYTDGGVGISNSSGKVRMNGSEVFKHAVQKMRDATLNIATENGIKIDEIDYFIPHQANIRIIDAVARSLNIDEAKVIKTVNEHANCSAASIPMAFATLKKSGKLMSGDIIAFSAIGAGLAWGSVIIKW